ncbi:hypothetical protein [Marinobacter sp. M-5]|uniref:hypothetical protein n=1 Tax=Marinobacter sp. M-5 TaxID=3081089 RepID=UPI00293CDDEF|nr:hypothetical protein [Marinobacter sp. M-5]MDV3503709.1 hypothetical protein [Marinobacter sp. M-5]
MWQALVEMDAVIHNYLGREGLVLLRASQATAYDTSEIKSPAITDRFWPVVCVPRNPRWETLCDSFGVQLPPIIERRFRLKKTPPVRLDVFRKKPDSSMDSQDEDQTRTGMFRTLRKVLNDLGDNAEFGEFHLQQKYGNHIQYLDVGSEILWVWSCTTSLKPGQRQYRNSTYFRMPIWTQGPPNRPRMLDRLTHLRNGYPWPTEGVEEGATEKMSTYIYKMKLWQTFLVAFAISKTFHSMEGPQWRWQTYQDRLPTLALPENQNEQPFHLFFSSPRTVCVVAPRFLAEFSKASMKNALCPLLGT